MQRVVRSTLAGFLALAALTACGDKTTAPTPTQVPPGVQLVTVTPATANLQVGDAITLSASVSADAGITDRSVTWASSNTAIATVDAATGAVKAIATGVATVTATAKADANVKGSALINVGGGSPVTVTISSVVSNVTGNNVDLANVFGQVDVTLNVDAGTNKLAGVDLLLNCNAPGFPAANDVVVATQTISSANVVAAEAAAAPVTLSFNTAQLDSTGLAPLFKNGACVVRGRARLAGSTQQSASNTLAITLNNVDFISVKTFSTTASTGQIASATDANGFAWRAGAVNVSLAAISFSGRSFATAAVSLVNGGNDNALGLNGATVAPNGVVSTIAGIAPASGLFTATFPNATTGAGAVGASTVDTLTIRVTTLDATGNAGPQVQTGATGTSFIRLDNRAPDLTGIAFTANTQNTNAGWVGKAFAFSIGAAPANPIQPGNSTTDNLTAIAGLNGVNNASAGGVGKVVDTTQFAPNATTTWTSFTSVGSLAETSAASGSPAYDLRLHVCDALGNCANTAPITTFGVDLTAPIAVVAAGSLSNGSTAGIGQSPNTTLNFDTTPLTGTRDPQGANGSTGSGFGPNPVLIQETRLAPSGATGQALTCVTGTLALNTAGTACAAIAATSFTQVLAATNPGQYQAIYTITDQAGNQTAATTVGYYIDQNAPVVSGGIGVPAAIGLNSQIAGTSILDNMDVAAAQGLLHYAVNLGAGASARFVESATLSATGVAFDNTLTRSVTATGTLDQFYRTLQTITTANPGVISAGLTPDSIGIRALDAAGNLSTTVDAFVPVANVPVGTTAPYVIGTQLNAFTIAASPTTVSNSTGSVTSTTISAIVNAVSPTADTPFGQICFYVATPSGAENGLGNAVTRTATNDLTLLTGSAATSCTTVHSTTQVPPATGNRVFTYSVTFDPAAGYGTAGTLTIVAIGTNAGAPTVTGGSDGLAAAPITITLQP
jgi:hypothetical protein